MGFLDKARAAAEQAAGKAKEGVEDLQARHDLSQAHNELGKVAFELIESGEIAHAKLEPAAAKIRALRERAAGGDAPTADEAEPSSTSEPPPPTPGS
jgi:hypothetical protein